MAGNGSQNGVLTPKQQKALAALLAEPTIPAAAAKLGMGESTLHKWLKDPAFGDAYREARREAVGQAIARLQHVSSAAVSVLMQVAADKSAPASARVSAASKILDMALRAVELEDLENRLSALEAQMEVGNARR